MLSKELLSLLCCPKCQGVLQEYETPPGLHCGACRLFYPIEEGIPNLLVAEAKPDSILSMRAPS